MTEMVKRLLVSNVLLLVCRLRWGQQRPGYLLVDTIALSPLLLKLHALQFSRGARWTPYILAGIIGQNSPSLPNLSYQVLTVTGLPLLLHPWMEGIYIKG